MSFKSWKSRTSPNTHRSPETSARGFPDSWPVYTRELSCPVKPVLQQRQWRELPAQPCTSSTEVRPATRSPWLKTQPQLLVPTVSNHLSRVWTPWISLHFPPCAGCSSSPPPTARARCPTTRSCSGMQSNPRVRPGWRVSTSEYSRSVTPATTGTASRERTSTPASKRSVGPGWSTAPIATSTTRILRPSGSFGPSLRWPVSTVMRGAAASPVAPAQTKTKSQWTRKNPYPATVLANRLLSGEDSAKEVRHFTFALGEDGLDYEAGDGLGIRPINDPALVEAIIHQLGVSGDYVVTAKDGSSAPLDQVLTSDYEISIPSRDLIEDIARRSGDAELQHILDTEDREALDAWLWGKDVLDLLQLDNSIRLNPEDLLTLLRPLQHRVYSISSSPLAHDGTVHLTVARVCATARASGTAAASARRTWRTASAREIGSEFLSPRTIRSAYPPMTLFPS